MRLEETPLLPIDTPQSIKVALSKVLRNISIKVNQLAGGNIAGIDNASTTVPASGTWRAGDFVHKSNPVEAGGGGSKYVITGWLRITSGSGNVLNTDWVEARVLTGN